MTQRSLTDYTASTDNANDTDDEQPTNEDVPETDSTNTDTETRECGAETEHEHEHVTGDHGLATTDGGIPFTDIFKETGATRINELELLEDENNRLYACVEADNNDADAEAIELSNQSIFSGGGIMSDDDGTITPEPGSVVRVDAVTGSVESINCSVLDDGELSVVTDGSAGHSD
jgi:hypothetical protein